MTPAKKAAATKAAAKTPEPIVESPHDNAPTAPDVKIVGAHKAKHDHGDGQYPTQPGVPPLANR